MTGYSELTLAVRDLVLAVDRYRARAGQRRGLSPNAVTALAHLHLEGPQTPTELARRLDITTASATELVDRLQRDDHVGRRPHPTDRRRLLVELTATGRVEIEAILGGFSAGLAQWAEATSEEELAAVVGFARAARRALVESETDRAS